MSYVVWGFVRVYLLLALMGAFLGIAVGIGYGVTALLGDPWGVVAGGVVLLAGLPLLIGAGALLDRLPEGNA